MPPPNPQLDQEAASRGRPAQTSRMRAPGGASGVGPARRAAVLCVMLMVAACSAAPGPGASIGASPNAEGPRSIRLAFVGDVMLGRGVADVAANDPGSIFESLRPALADADLAFANLESPLTTRSHATNGYALEADPALAPLLAAAGLDVVDLANNHAVDAGPATVLDTVSAIRAAGLSGIGTGADETGAAAPLVLDADGVRVGVLAFNMTGGSRAATAVAPGVNAWSRAAAEASVTSLRPDVDLLVVGLHGGVEYLPRPDPALQQAVEDLAAWGADVVWGHGAHVPYPVTVAGGPRPAVLAPGLGNALFDQQLPGTDEGAVLEVLADAGGVVAMRTGAVSIRAGRATFTGWHDPAGDAVSIHGEWWTPVRPVTEAASGNCDAFDIRTVVAGLREGSRVVAASCGAVTGPEATEMAIAYRRPFTRELLQDAYPGRRWSDAEGLAAHLAVMTPDARMVWGAATLPEPIGAVAVCSGSLAIGYTTLDDPSLIAAGAWTWRGFGFSTAPPLTHPSSIGCADVDRDGATEPYVRRSTMTSGGTAR